MNFINNCLFFNTGLLFVFGIFISVRRFTLKTLPLLLVSVTGLAEVLLLLTNIEIGENIHLFLNSLLLIALFSYAIFEHKKIVEGFKSLAQKFMNWANS